MSQRSTIHTRSSYDPRQSLSETNHSNQRARRPARAAAAAAAAAANTTTHRPNLHSSEDDESSLSSSSLSEPAVRRTTTKRARKTKTSNNVKKDGKRKPQAQTATTSAMLQEKLNELNALEKSVRDGTHSELMKYWQEIEEKRTQRVALAEAQCRSTQHIAQTEFDARVKAAQDQFMKRRAEVRRSMMNDIQDKIKRLQEERQLYSHRSQQGPGQLSYPKEVRGSIHISPPGLSDTQIMDDLLVARNVR
ncbi:hypothetical protein BCR43DRAFT_490302 [Syncephalastrum racemosum]|uniref:Sds3-like-domain-containing protein n=1 Tax=Syncephalastrum racemosum TaxID=13706 RepID=A0A1X2HFQ5_SYNRA|nr:hypothetical protein BCR43DRAFT_490302 [Syncephalastrum racemosum]